MKIVDARVINDKLFILIEKHSGNLLALETRLAEFDIGFAASVISSPDISGTVYLCIDGAKVIPEDWKERMQNKVLEPPKVQIEDKSDVEFKDV